MSKDKILFSVVVFLLVALSPVSQAADLATDRSPHIEVFTTENQPITGVNAILEDNPWANLHVHKLDAIERLEDELSSGLSANPDHAKRQALQRLQRISSDTEEQLERTARALAAAAQLGIEKYPAIVFDHKVVIYGLTDLPLALSVYRKWQEDQSS